MRRSGRAAVVAACLALLLIGCGREPAPPRPSALVLKAVSFADLPGWTEDDQGAALAAFVTSCTRPPRPRHEDQLATAQAWRVACAEARRVTPAAARDFFETSFTAFAVTDNGDAVGRFTGYYEPLLEGARQPDATHRWPLYRRPPDLVSVDLGTFAPDLEGRRIAGKVMGGKLVHYADRTAIDRGALAGRGLELLWVADPVQRFFVEIQGAGRVRLANGGAIRVGYDGQNGWPYRAIGKDMVATGAIAKDQVSMQAIRAWLEAHPDRATAVMQLNPSYVFFRELPHEGDVAGPPGAQGTPLTPGRSLAVDRRFLPLGMPLWLDTTAPAPQGSRPLRRLVVAQDTGGAIRGVVRGDLFWGSGPEAEYEAGHMKQAGRYYVLVPRQLTPTS